MKRGWVLVTGCSTGIGRAAARLFAEQGWPVLATARRLEAIKDLEGYHGIRTAALDVTDPAACERIVAEAPDLEVLVNNAGYGQMGPLEMVPEERFREQFEVNVFGLMRLSRLALPVLRRRGGGTIVQVGSVVGKFTYPFGGAYCATKHAVESICDALRVEVRPFGVRVVLVEPGPIATAFGETAHRGAVSLAGAAAGTPYARFAERARRRLEDRGMPGAPASDVARVIVRAAMRERPAARYVVTLRGRLFLLMRWVLPDAVWDFLIGRAFGLR